MTDPRPLRPTAFPRRLPADNRRGLVGAAVLAALLALLAAGCEMPDLARGSRERALAEASEATEHREKFIAQGDPQSVRWLLANRVGSGMTRGEVNDILGQHGERVFEDNWLKSGTSGVRETDEAYRWGPDSEGQTYYLFFRDDRLVNHDPAVYRD
jgi:hypothetical protein